MNVPKTADLHHNQQRMSCVCCCRPESGRASDSSTGSGQEVELPVNEEVVIALEEALRAAPLAARRRDEVHPEGPICSVQLIDVCSVQLVYMYCVPLMYVSLIEHIGHTACMATANKCGCLIALSLWFQDVQTLCKLGAWS